MRKYLEFEDKKFQKKVEREIESRMESRMEHWGENPTKSIVAYIAHNFVQKEKKIEAEKQIFCNACRYEADYQFANQEHQPCPKCGEYDLTITYK